MNFGIFPRSTAGYLMVLFLLGGSNVYAILKLVQFNDIILESHIADTRMLEAEKRIVDYLFSQMRYEQKYILTKDIALFNQYLVAVNEFENLLVYISAGPGVESLRAFFEGDESPRFSGIRSVAAEQVRRDRSALPGGCGSQRARPQMHAGHGHRQAGKSRPEAVKFPSGGAERKRLP
jgi:hypothetical protein